MGDTEWVKNESMTLGKAKLASLRRVVDNESPVIVEHRFFKRARAPYRFVTDDFDALVAYIHGKVASGDAVYFWKFEECCNSDNAWLWGKQPDASGNIPAGGSY